MERAKLEISPPYDRLNIIYFILLLHGVGTLMPWNMFINAKDASLFLSKILRIFPIFSYLFSPMIFSISSNINCTQIIQTSHRNMIRILCLPLDLLHKFRMSFSIGWIFFWILGKTTDNVHTRNSVFHWYRYTGKNIYSTYTPIRQICLELLPVYRWQWKTTLLVFVCACINYSDDHEWIFFLLLFGICSGSLTPRIVCSIVVEVLIFIFTVALAMIDSSGWPGPFFWITMVSVVILNSEPYTFNLRNA